MPRKDKPRAFAAVNSDFWNNAQTGDFVFSPHLDEWAKVREVKPSRTNSRRRVCTTESIHDQLIIVHIYEGL